MHTLYFVGYLYIKMGYSFSASLHRPAQALK